VPSGIRLQWLKFQENRKGILEAGPANTTVPIFGQMMTPRSIFLTPNNNTPYTWFWLDLRNGPLVLQIPPKVLGLIDDMWYKFVTGSGMMVPAFGVVGGTPGWAVRRMIPIDSRFNLLMQTTDGVLV